jgi:RND superfamily putative drug exporter
MFHRLAAFSERFAWALLAAWLVAAVAITAAAPSLQDVGTQDTTEFLPADAPSQLAERVLERLFPDDPSRESAILVFARDGKLTDADRAYLGQLEPFLRSPGVEPVVGEVQTTATAPDLAPFLRAPDGEAELVIVGLTAPPFTSRVTRFIEQLRDHLDDTAPAGLRHHVTGIAGLGTDQAEAVTESFDRTAVASVLLVLLILFFVYRSAVAPFIPLVTIGLAFLVSRGLIGYMADAGVKVSSQVETFMIVMIFGAGTDYCLFLVSRYKEELERGDPVPVTVRRAMTVMGAVIAASAGTVIVGFASQATAQSGIFKTMGPSIGLAVFVTLIASLTLTPALLKLVGRNAFWPSKLDAVRDEADKHSARWDRVAVAIKERPAVVLLAGIIVLQLLAAGLGWFETSFDLVGELPGGADAREGFEVLSEHYPGGAISPIYLVIEAGGPIVDDARLEAIDRLTDRLRSVEGIAEVRSVTQPAGRPLTTETLNEFGLGSGAGQASGLGIDPNKVDVTPLFAALASPDGLRFTGPVLRAYPQIQERLALLLGTDGNSTRLIVAMDGNPYAGKSLDVFRSIDDVAAATLGGTALAGAELSVGGPTSFYSDLRTVGADDFRVITAVLLGAIFIVLALLLRSVVAPFYLLATVVLSYLATMGVAVVVFQGLGNAEGISFWLPPFLFVILVALGADYNIFIMSRIREEAEAGHEIHEAAARGLVLTGHVITSAGLILAGTFAALMLAPLPNMRQIGFAVTFGVLIDTFVVRSLLVPSATMLLGRWAFWPSGVGRERAAVERRHVGVAAAGVAAFALVLVLIAVTGGRPGPVTKVSATALTPRQQAAVLGDRVTPSTDASGPTSTSAAPATTAPVTAPRGTGTAAPPTTVTPSSPSPAGPTRIAVPATGGWRYHAEGTRKIGTAGSTQPFSEDVVTEVSRGGGTGDAPELRLVTESGQGRQEETRRYSPAAVDLLATQQSSGGFGFGGTFNNPQPLIKWPVRIGETWTTDWYTNGVSGRTTSKVLGERQVSAAGRTYRCYDVKSDSTFSGQAQGEQHQTACWVVELGMAVETQGEYRGSYNGVPFDLRQHAVLTGTP